MSQRVWRRAEKPRVVRAIVAINIFVFLFWQLPIDSVTEFMMNNFLVSGEGLASGYLWTLLTSVFSHASFLHIFVNMYVFFGFGTILELALGHGRFLFFYLVAGIVASLSHALISSWLMHSPELPALGASGAIAGVVMVFSFLFPKERILIFGLIPVPAIWGAILMMALDIWGLSFQVKGGGLPIGYGAHLGGAFTGILYYFFFLKPFFAKNISRDPNSF